MDYRAAVQALSSRGRFGISLGLDRIRAVLDELGHPERSLHGALVGGTNGKGSVVALAASVLADAGISVGSMPKPHLVSYRERIAVDGRPLDERAFAAAVEHVLPAVDRVAARLGAPTEFEVLTAAAFAELARRALDLALVEVGMGGRLDATHAADLGVAVVTNVQHDHERYLGRTLRLIGTEKAAIIERGDLAVTGAGGNGLAPILERCAQVGAPLRRAGPRQPYSADVRDVGWDGVSVDLRRPRGDLAGVRLGLLGSHQARNAAVATALLDALAEDAARRGHRLAISDAAIRRGFAAARWAGRMELLDGSRAGISRVLLDGAHNPAGARALARSLAELGVRRPLLVFGAMRGKRVDAVLRALAPLSPRPIFTAVADPHAIPPAELLRRWRRIGRGGRVAHGPRRALDAASALSDGAQPVVVAGSLYLVGAVRGMLRSEEDA